MKRDIQSVDDDIARKKRIIERKLYEDPDIIEILDDPDVDPDCPDEIIYSSIYPCIRIPGTQDVSKNFITFSIDDTERMPYNQVMKTQIVQFVIFVHNLQLPSISGKYPESHFVHLFEFEHSIQFVIDFEYSKL